ARQVLLLPSTQQGSGPFPYRSAQWVNAENLNSGQRFAADQFQAGRGHLREIERDGGDGPTTVEGPFAQNPLFIRMLAAATERPVIASETSTGTSIGAALLASDGAPAMSKGERTEPPTEPAWQAYTQAWRKNATA
ncbi:carbohydrate kinase, partial [Mesorhizobium sp. M2A.F.Ca.ET.042.01.1.1]